MLGLVKLRCGSLEQSLGCTVHRPEFASSSVLDQNDPMHPGELRHPSAKWQISFGVFLVSIHFQVSGNPKTLKPENLVLKSRLNTGNVTR